MQLLEQKTGSTGVNGVWGVAANGSSSGVNGRSSSRELLSGDRSPPDITLLAPVTVVILFKETRDVEASFTIGSIGFMVNKPVVAWIFNRGVP